jgi:outer membrane murein-binding lipoprotein Lpp
MVWLESWLATIPALQALAWIGGVVVVVVLAIKFVPRGWRAFRHIVSGLTRAIALVDTLATLPDDIGFIKHELDDNSGGSVKDAVKRTEKAVEDLSGVVGQLQRDLTHVRGQAASLKTSLAKTNRRLDDREPRPVQGSLHEGSAT